MPEFRYQEMFPHANPVEIPWRRLDIDGVTVGEYNGRRVLEVSGEALSALAAEAMRDVSHLYRPGHLQQLRDILEDPEASDNDRFVAEALLRQAREESLWRVKFLCVGVGGILAYDLFLISEALLFRRWDPALTQARGVISLLAAPLVAIAAPRAGNGGEAGDPDGDDDDDADGDDDAAAASLALVGLASTILSKSTSVLTAVFSLIWALDSQRSLGGLSDLSSKRVTVKLPSVVAFSSSFACTVMV